MIFLIILALIICIIALVMTLFSISKVDKNYNTDSSLKNLSLIYVIIIPVITAFLGLIWFFIA